MALRRSFLRIHEAYLLETFGSWKIRNFGYTPSCLQLWRDTMSNFSIKEPQDLQKNSVYPKTFYLYHHITRNSCRNRYTLIKKSYLHWRGIAIYLYSQLTKLLLISSNMNYRRKRLIYLNQVYTFQWNQIKFENPKSTLPLKRFTIVFLTTLNMRKPKVR